MKPNILDLKKSIAERCDMIKVIGGRNKGANIKTMLGMFKAVLSKILYGAHLYSRGDQKVRGIISPHKSVHRSGAKGGVFSISA